MAKNCNSNALLDLVLSDIIHKMFDEIREI